MTLRESANSFIQNLIASLNKDLFFSTNFSGKNWNCLHSKVAREYILTSLAKIKDYQNMEFRFMVNQDRVFNLEFNFIKTPISTLGLDDEFNWSNITLN